tara:strand:- start:3040 stop:3708 length:669 start_codon:yes stop_codon:yes gene_type:complete
MRNRFLEVHLNSSSGRIARSFRIPKIVFFLISGVLSILLTFMIISTFFFFSESSDYDNYINKKEIDDYFAYKINQRSDDIDINFISPISSNHFYISKEFNDTYHQGIDIISKRGSNVRASALGSVIYTGHDDIYGKIIILAHTNNFYTFYGHLDTSFVKKHDVITKNQLIGLVGETGKTTGPHLHFEIWDEWSSKNPLKLIESLANKDLTTSKELEETNVTK